jgi:hypothetical protein
MKDINGDELFNNDQVLITTKIGQSLEKVIVENDRYFLSGLFKTPLTEEIIKIFEITKYKKDYG